MLFNKTLRALLRAKQEGQNDSYKAGFNDALALLDQEEQHIEFEFLQTDRTFEGSNSHKHVYVHENDDENKCNHIVKNPHDAMERVEERAEEIEKQALSELAPLLGENNSSDYVEAPKISVEPEKFSLEETLEEGFKNVEINDSTMVSTSIIEDNSQEDLEDQYKYKHKHKHKNKDENVVENKHEDVELTGDLDDDEVKKQRQLAALALARRKVKEEDDGEDDE